MSRSPTAMNAIASGLGNLTKEEECWAAQKFSKGGIFCKELCFNLYRHLLHIYVSALQEYLRLLRNSLKEGSQGRGPKQILLF